MGWRVKVVILIVIYLAGETIYTGYDYKNQKRTLEATDSVSLHILKYRLQPDNGIPYIYYDLYYEYKGVGYSTEKGYKLHDFIDFRGDSVIVGYVNAQKPTDVYMSNKVDMYYLIGFPSIRFFIFLIFIVYPLSRNFKGEFKF